MGAGSTYISGAALHASIVKICAEADLEMMTKRSVRQKLEEEYGTDLGGRKDEISRIVEAVIEQDVSANILRDDY
jgi:chitin synthase